MDRDIFQEKIMQIADRYMKRYSIANQQGNES